MQTKCWNQIVAIIFEVVSAQNGYLPIYLLKKRDLAKKDNYRVRSFNG